MSFHKPGAAVAAVIALATGAHAQSQAVSSPTSQPSDTAKGSLTAPTPPGPTPYEDGRARYERAQRDQSIRFYPQEAQRAGVSGKAVLDCFVDAGGWLRDCNVATDEPSGFGFGEAALRLVPLFHMKKSETGARAQIPITFKLPP